MLQESHYFIENAHRWRHLRNITTRLEHGDADGAGLMLLWACDPTAYGEPRNSSKPGTRSRPTRPSPSA
jgi:hypothetical protein